MGPPLNSNNNRPLAILSANIRGLSTKNGKFKIPLLLEKAISENVGFITLTESHLHEDFMEGEIHMMGFQNFRADRKKGILKGGIITYVRDDLLPGLEVKVAGSIGCIEYQVINVKKLDITAITIYRPPTSRCSDFMLVIEAIKSVLHNITPEPRLILTGDLNFPSINWESQIIGPCQVETRQQAQLLLNFFESMFLEQYVEDATRINNILDIFATNDQELISSITVEKTDRRVSDHNLLLIKTRISAEDSAESTVPEPHCVLDRLNFWSTTIDWQAMKSDFSNTDWVDALESPNIDTKAAKLLSHIEKICLKYVPNKVDQRQSTIPRDRRIIMSKRQKMRAKLLSTRDLRSLSSLERKLVELDRQLVDSYDAELLRKEKKAIGKIKENSKFFYNYARSKSKMKSPIGPLFHNNKPVTDPQEMSEILKTHFESVFNAESLPPNMEELRKDYGCRSMEDIDFCEDDIESIIMEIPQNSSPGPDGIPAILLRNCAAELKKPIYILWRASLDAGHLPKYMKNCVVTPVFKKGDRSLAENYRPISLISHLCKLFERIIVKKLTAYLEEADLYNEEQHGFRKGRSCLSQLLEHHQKILAALEQHRGVDVVYLDFAKAFDKVDYNILMWKLKSIGVCGKVLEWIGDFLVGRTQSIKVSGQLSSRGSVNSGVPQGSSLGPLLFLIMISDINRNVENVDISSFADDTRIVSSIGSNSDCCNMQDDLIGVYRWAFENNMKFNSNKFELISYSAQNRDLNEINEYDKLFNYPQYFDPDGNTIASVETVKDLGVKMCNNASFEIQINESARKGSRMAGWILRVFKTRLPDALLTLFKTMVLPHLEYCCPLWSPTTLGKIREIEAVQRSFTAKVHGLTNLNYWERLQRLNLYSIERRRERYLIIYIYKIIIGVVPNLKAEKFTLVTETSARRGRTCNVPRLNPRAAAKIKSKIDASFPVYGAKLFNCLPKNLRDCDASVNTFKKRLDKFLKMIPDQPCLPGYQQPASSNSIIEQLALLRTAGIYFNN